MSDLPPGLDDFGKRLEQAAQRDIEPHRRGRPRRPKLRALALPVAAAVLAAGASAGAVRLVDGGEGEPIEPEPDGKAAAVRTAEDPSVVVRSAVDDPDGGPPWVLRIYTDGAGQECIEVGQLRAGRLGRQQRGQFRALPSSSAGSCAPAGHRSPLLAVRRTRDLTLVFGLAIDRDTVTVSFGDATRRVQPAGLGAFVAVFKGGGPGRPVEVRSSVRGRTDVRRLG